MRSNYRQVIKTLQDTLTGGVANAVNKSVLTAFKENNEVIRTSEGIPKIPIYQNVRFTKATNNRSSATLRVYDKAQVQAKWYSPMQNATGVVFMRPVKLGNRLVTQVAHAFIPKNLRRVQDNKNPFKRISNKRLPIVKLKTSTLYDYYLWTSHSTRLVQIYEQIFERIVGREIINKMTQV